MKTKRGGRPHRLRGQRRWWPWVGGLVGLMVAVALGLVLRGGGPWPGGTADESSTTGTAAPTLVLYQTPT